MHQSEGIVDKVTIMKQKQKLKAEKIMENHGKNAKNWKIK
jgi:alkyl hydroperoxide reductase subunit AhpF